MKKLLYLIVLSSLNLFSQQESFYSLYMYNMQVVNPAYAGSEESGVFTLLNRNQWAEVENAPKTTALSYSSAMKKNVGLGISVVSDDVFIEQQTFTYIDFSYKLKTTEKSNLYLGIKAGGNFYRSDPSELIGYSTTADPLQRTISQFNPNIGAGLYYQHDKYWLSFSVPRLFNAKRDNDLVITAKDRVHTYLGAGMTIPINEALNVRPSFMYRKVKGLPTSFDLTGFINYQNDIDLGFSYRTDASSSLMLMFYPIKGFQIGYAYETPSEQMLSGISLKTHELILRIRLGDGVETPTEEEAQEVEENEETF